MRILLGLAAAILAGCVLAACGGAGGHTMSTTSEATVRGPSGGERTCPTSGSTGLPPGYRRHARLVADVALGGLGDLSEQSEAAPSKGGRYGAIESIVVVPAGREVTITVPRGERTVVGLVYDTRKFRDDGLYRISELDSSFRFVACGDPDFNHGVSQFDGGYVVSGRRCVRIDVVIRGEPVRHVRFPVGARCT